MALCGAGQLSVRSDPLVLKRLGFWQLFALGLNGIVGVGIFFTPASVARLAPGWASVLVFGAVAIGLVPVALAFAKLAARFDEDGGPVLYAREAFGETAGFLVGWISYVSAVASTAAVMAGLARALVGPDHALGVALSLVTAIAGVTAVGLSISAGTWTFLTVAKIVPLLGLVLAGLLVGGAGGGDVVATAAISVPAPASPLSLLRAGLVAVFAYQGFEIVPLVAGQAETARRRVPLALLASLGAAAVLYVALQSVVVRALPGLAASSAPLSEAAAVLGGPRFGRIIGLTTSVSALGIAVGMMAMTPRYLANAWSSRGGLGLGRHSSSGVPQRALLVTWALVLILLLQGSLGQLLELSSIAVLSQYGATVVALAVLSARRARGLTPGDAWVVPPALLVTLSLVTQATPRQALVAAGCLALGVVLRFLTSAAGR